MPHGSSDRLPRVGPEGASATISSGAASRDSDSPDQQSRSAAHRPIPIPMRTLSILAPALLGALTWAGATEVSGAAPPPDPALHARHAEDWGTLSSAWDEALAAWEAAYESATDIQSRRTLRDEHPALEYWPRFEALAPTEPRVSLWQIDFAGRAGYPGKQGRAVKAAAYTRAFGFEGALDAEWMEPLLERLAGDRKAVGQDVWIERLERVAEQAQSPANRARALLIHGTYLSKQGQSQRERAIAMLERALTFEGTAAAAEVESGGTLYYLRYVAIGATAPDFTAATADGGTFKLSEQRGKIVVLDFFGFW